MSLSCCSFIRVAPFPVTNLRQVLAVFVDVLLMFDQLVFELLLQVDALVARPQMLSLPCSGPKKGLPASEPAAFPVCVEGPRTLLLLPGGAEDTAASAKSASGTWRQSGSNRLAQLGTDRSGRLTDWPKS